MLKRVAKADAESQGGDDQGNSKKAKKQKKMRWKHRKTAFVNQLPYTATEAQVAAHFADVAETSQMEVRMVTNRKNGKFRGIAFLDVCSQEALDRALGLNLSTFKNDDDERQINVTEAHAQDDDKKLTQAQQNKRAMSKEGIAEVDALIAREVASGTLSHDDFDHRALDFLHSAPQSVALQAVAEFAELDKSTVKNRCEHLPSDLHACVRARNLLFCVLAGCALVACTLSWPEMSYERMIKEPSAIRCTQ